jgi:cell division protein FtsQ
MAQDYTYLPEITAQSRSEKFLRVFIVFAVMCLAGELIWLLGISPLKPFSKIEISGYDRIAVNEILAKAGITAYSSYISTDAAELEKALLGFASVRSVQVFKHFPDRLQIALEGRRAAAFTLAILDGRTVPLLVDNEGVIFGVGREEEKEDYLSGAIPLVSGFFIERPFLGMKLPFAHTSLFAELEKIRNSAPELLGAVSEIRINRKPFDGFDLILYPVHKKIRVRLSELNEDVLRYTLLMIDVLSSNESGIDSFDFRSGIASYIPKEASSE